MDFSQTMINRLTPTLQRYHLYVDEQRPYFLRLKSDFLMITLVHNQLENSCTLWIGRNNENSDVIEIDNEVMQTFFSSGLKLSQVATDSFISNVTLFFNNEAKALLTGNPDVLSNLEVYSTRRSHSYTNNLLKNQNMEKANKAWTNNNYDGFIKIIDLIGKENLPESYRLKYKIASKKK